jgi:predicted alpha-1,2-mannosidase
MHLDQPFATYGTFAGPLQSPGVRNVIQAEKDPPIGAWVTFPASDKERVVTARIGISFVDIAGARTNLDREVARHSFDDIHKQTAAAWEKALNVITVQGGTTAQKSVFYTSLYHCLLMPNVASDADGRYLGFDNKVHQIAPSHALYANFSGWDIYRTEAPLLALIAPDRVQDMCDSIALMYRQGGWIDRWPTANTYTNVMCGSPLTTMVATAWNYGLHDFDMPTAYEGMVKDATQLPPGGKPYLGQAHNDWFDKVGYIPDDKEGYGAVSQTEEDCIAYAALSSVAESLGKSGDAAKFRAKSLLYRNLFDPETKFLRPRLADGTWYSPFNPAEEHGFVEGTGWHYRWMVPHDVAGLIHLFGGDDAFNTQLDTFFTYDKPAWRGNIYNPYNETDLEAPFLYDYSGKPASTQALVRKLLTQVYTTAPDGIPGNDDCGTMSAWCVWAMLGLYPTDPARPAFELCSPVFTRATVHLADPYTGKTLTIEAPAASPENALIQSVQWNGKAVNGPWVRQTDLVNGGTLKFTLGTTSDKTWGVPQGARPPSLSGGK